MVNERKSFYLGYLIFSLLLFASSLWINIAVLPCWMNPIGNIQLCGDNFATGLLMIIFLLFLICSSVLLILSYLLKKSSLKSWMWWFLGLPTIIIGGYSIFLFLVNF